MNSPTDHASIGKPSSIIWHMDHKMTQNLYRFVEWIQLYKEPSKPQRRTYSLAVLLTLYTSRSAAAALSCFIHESLWPETDYTHFCLYHWVNSPLPPTPMHLWSIWLKSVVICPGWVIFQNCWSWWGSFFHFHLNRKMAIPYFIFISLLLRGFEVEGKQVSFCT